MGTIGIARRRVLTALAVLAAALLLWGASAYAAPPDTYTGTTSDGGSWVADLSANWNGTLLLYSHGYGTTNASDAPDPATKMALLARGYALAGAGMGPPTGSLWVLRTAVDDQFETLDQVRQTVLPHRPDHVLAVGTSMGGLISSLEAEQARGRIDGALSTSAREQAPEPPAAPLLHRTNGGSLGRDSRSAIDAALRLPAAKAAGAVLAVAARFAARAGTGFPGCCPRGPRRFVDSSAVLGPLKTVGWSPSKTVGRWRWSGCRVAV